ncbi:MAG: hypothetical protein PVI43_00875 [Candidatus Bathyarchaeota archaeon]|jgi:hypothetical protein
MTYDPNIPEGSDILAESQQDLLNNASDADTDFSVDHVALSATSNNGKHKFSTYRHDPTIFAPATDTDEIALFPSLNPNNRVNLFAKYPQIEENEELNIEAATGQTLGIAPFAASYFRLAGGGGTTILGNAINLTATWTATIITCTFTTNAANASYFVRIGIGNQAATFVTFGAPYVANQTVSQFEIRKSSSANNFAAGNEFYVMVYEV